MLFPEECDNGQYPLWRLAFQDYLYNLGRH
ncbi:hypothetical protein BH10CYA1_BH10CYA1_63380 [soil metagenome]